MSIPLAWLDSSHTVLVQNFNRKWTMDDYYEAIEATYTLIDMVDHPVDIIVDISQKPASTSRLISAAGEVADETEMTRVHPNQRMMIVVGGGQFMRTIVDMGMKYAPRLSRSLFAADSFDEARMLIARGQYGYNAR